MWPKKMMSAGQISARKRRTEKSNCVGGALRLRHLVMNFLDFPASSLKEFRLNSYLRVFDPEGCLKVYWKFRIMSDCELIEFEPHSPGQIHSPFQASRSPDPTSHQVIDVESGFIIESASTTRESSDEESLSGRDSDMEAASEASDGSRSVSSMVSEASIPRDAEELTRLALSKREWAVRQIAEWIRELQEEKKQRLGRRRRAVRRRRRRIGVANALAALRRIARPRISLRKKREIAVQTEPVEILLPGFLNFKFQ